MPQWDSFGWILAIAFVIGFGFMARFIYTKIRAKRAEKDKLL